MTKIREAMLAWAHYSSPSAMVIVKFLGFFLSVNVVKIIFVKTSEIRNTVSDFFFYGFDAGYFLGFGVALRDFFNSLL